MTRKYFRYAATSLLGMVIGLLALRILPAASSLLAAGCFRCGVALFARCLFGRLVAHALGGVVLLEILAIGVGV